MAVAPMKKKKAVIASPSPYNLYVNRAVTKMAIII
jgi:hypothetical protein